MSRGAARRFAAASLRSAGRADWKSLISRSVAAYNRMPTVSVPEPSWAGLMLSCMETGRAATYNPVRPGRTPAYGMCRMDRGNPYAPYGFGYMHAHETLFSFCTALTDGRLAARHVMNHYALQRPDGSIPYGVHPDGSSGGMFTTPLCEYEALNAYLWGGDRRLLKESYEHGKKHHAWWMRERHRGDSGLAFGNGLERDCPIIPGFAMTGGYTCQSVYQNGLDLNCYLAVQERSLAGMAGLLGRKAEARKYDRACARRARRSAPSRPPSAACGRTTAARGR